MEKPVANFRAGTVQASIFMNEREVKGVKTKIPSISFQKRYRGEDDKWKSTNSLGLGDIPKAIFVLFKAYDHLLSIKAGDEGTADEPEEET